MDEYLLLTLSVIMVFMFLKFEVEPLSHVLALLSLHQRSNMVDLS